MQGQILSQARMGRKPLLPSGVWECAVRVHARSGDEGAFPPAQAQDFYGTTLEALVEAKNERLWFKTQLKLCGLWFRLREFGRAQRILRELHRRARALCL